MLRSDVSLDEPQGKCWIEISSSIRPTQIVSNYHLVYALDSKGSVYLRTNTDEVKEGTNWIKVLKDLSDISVSMSDQVVYC